MGPTAGQSQPVTIRSAIPSDLPNVLHLRQTQEIAESGTPYTTAERLTDEWEALGPRLGAQIWVAEAADESVLACAELARTDQTFVVRLWALPGHRDNGLELALLARAEQRAYAIGREEGADSVVLFAQATSSHPEAQHALLRSGFVVSSTYEALEAPLNEPPPNPDAITGIAIRPFADGQDLEAVYRADEEAFQDQRGHTPRAFAQWRQRLHQSDGAPDPSLWLVAWDGDEVAGAALGEVVQGVGWVHHLFVRRPWRRRGLGAALTRASLGAFYRQGIGCVRLNVDADSLTNAQRLYRREGFHVTGAYTNYQKITPLA